MTPPTIYRNVDSVLSVLNQRVDSEGVAALLQIYNNALKASNEGNQRNVATQRHPLIVLEGLDGCGKSTTAYKLAKQLNAAKWCTPPESIKQLRHSFDTHPELRSAYYALGNYIAALEVSEVMNRQPVVMDRYWHSTAAFALAQAINDFPNEQEIPPKGDGFYQWPHDLFKPDIVLFLDVNENVRMQRLSRRTQSTLQEALLKNKQSFRDNVVLAYKNMMNPPVIFINSNLSPKPVLAEITNKITHLLSILVH